jgi:hypothetical protein
MAERKTRLWLASLMIGLGTAAILTVTMTKMRIVFWFPPAWPGLFLTWLCAILNNGQDWPSESGLLVFTAGNAIFYAWFSLHVLRAEVQARGHLSRYFLRESVQAK